MVAPFMHCFVPHQGNWELTACPQLLRDGSVRSDQELNPGPLGLGANVLTTTPSRLTDGVDYIIVG